MLFSCFRKKVVAFDVRLYHHVNNLTTNGQVVFRRVDLNERKGYDPSAGIFTAPASGMYVFYWTILTLPGKYACTSLLVNGKIKSWNHCNDTVSKTQKACSKMTVVKEMSAMTFFICIVDVTNRHNYYSRSCILHLRKRTESSY